MFTGIVQARGTVQAIEPHAFGARLVIDRSAWRPDPAVEPAHGDSVCVSGVCLTVTATDGQTLSFDVIAETLAKTSLGDRKPGDAVNLEPAVTASQPLGGHFMQGHVDGVGTISHLHAGDEEWRVTITPPAELLDYIVPKGSIAVDGVSLTVAAVGETSFEVALIPTTLELTTLKDRQVGDRVNLETDILSKTVVHQLRRREQGGGAQAAPATWQTLRDAGFLADEA